MDFISHRQIKKSLFLQNYNFVYTKIPLNSYYKINKNISIGILKDKLIKVLLKKRVNLECFCNKLKKQMKRSIVPIIPNRKYERQKKKRKKYPMNQRRAL